MLSFWGICSLPGYQRQVEMELFWGPECDLWSSQGKLLGGWWTLGVSKALLSRLRVGLCLQPVGPYGRVIRAYVHWRRDWSEVIWSASLQYSVPIWVWCLNCRKPWTDFLEGSHLYSSGSRHSFWEGGPPFNLLQPPSPLGSSTHTSWAMGAGPGADAHGCYGAGSRAWLCLLGKTTGYIRKNNVSHRIKGPLDVSSAELSKDSFQIALSFFPLGLLFPLDSREK